MKENTRGIGRTRSWTFILYPESAPGQWRDLLDEIHVEWVESPLHDKDINANGEVKKDHLHILVMFDSVKSYEQVKEITDNLNAPIPQKVAGVKGLVRYMAHLDNPEKAQYNIKDIVAHGGADIDELLRITATQKYAMLDEILAFIDDNACTEFSDLLKYARVYRRDDWFPFLADEKTYLINSYIKSYRHSTKGKEEHSC